MVDIQELLNIYTKPFSNIGTAMAKYREDEEEIVDVEVEDSPTVLEDTRIEDTMVGRVTNYDKLVLEISTDGSIEIQDALSYAVELLKIHVNPFTNIGNNMSKFRGNEDETAAMSTETENNIEDMKIEELDFTVRSYNCLKKAGVNTISDLTSMSYIELLKIKNLGRKSLNEIIDKMKELGYDLSEEASN